MRSQSGSTLISIMVGLLISMIGILTSLMLFKNLINITGQLKLDAHLDGNLSNTMQYLYLEMNSAGYGLDSATSNHLVVDNSNPLEPAVYWREVSDAGDLECRGILDSSRTAINWGVENSRQLIELQLADSTLCTEDIDLSSISWVDKTILAEFSVDIGPVFSFDLQEAQCSGFGYGEKENRNYLVIEALNSAVLARMEEGVAIDDIAKNKVGVCLSNYAGGNINV